MSLVELTELTRAELEDALHAAGIERYRARQVFRWVYRRGVSDYHRMTDLSGGHRETLAGQFQVSTLPVAHRDETWN